MFFEIEILKERYHLNDSDALRNVNWASSRDTTCIIFCALPCCMMLIGMECQCSRLVCCGKEHICNDLPRSLILHRVMYQ